MLALTDTKKKKRHAVKKNCICAMCTHTNDEKWIKDLSRASNMKIRLPRPSICFKRFSKLHFSSFLIIMLTIISALPPEAARFVAFLPAHESQFVCPFHELIMVTMYKLECLWFAEWRVGNNFESWKKSKAIEDRAYCRLSESFDQFSGEPQM